jgi:hypothetical protein
LIVSFPRRDRPQYVVKLRNRSINISETIKEFSLMKVHQKVPSVIERRTARMNLGQIKIDCRNGIRNLWVFEQLHKNKAIT